MKNRIRFLFAVLMTAITLMSGATVANASVPFGTSQSQPSSIRKAGSDLVTATHMRGFQDEMNRLRKAHGLAEIPRSRFIYDAPYNPRNPSSMSGQVPYLKECLNDVMTYHKTRKRYIHVNGHCNAPVIYWNYNIKTTDTSAARAWWNSTAHRDILYKPKDRTQWWLKGGSYGQCLSVTFVRAHDTYYKSREKSVPMSNMAVAHWRPCHFKPRS